jgi:endogenous inhibitor of DNA gyrase (YacG/DUF329 family)
VADEKVPCTKCGKPISAESAGKRNGMCLLCSIEHEEKVPCVECGKPVSTKQAAKRNGLCLRCSAKRDPFFVLYSSLIDRVCHSSGGFDALSDAEKLYYALILFQNEVNNGGFHQFFFNSSGSYYDLIESGLVAFDEPQTLELLSQAKAVVFPEMAVPVDTEERRSRMPGADPSAPTLAWMTKWNELDQKFYRGPDTLTPKLQAFARERGLVPPETDDK